jgi:NAD-reducing hydrogenase small subunit
MSKIRIATTWLDGCSGCHMSFVDMDERLVALADKVEVVYGPLVDQKEIPTKIDLTLVEGAVSNEDDYEKIKTLRERSKILASLGDCAVAGNVPAMRNLFSLDDVLDRAYYEHADISAQIPQISIPKLFAKVRPLHEVVPVDLFIPGCPPSSDAIDYVLTELIEGRIPQISQVTRFGA